MSKFGDFVKRHWFLICSIVLTLAMLIAMIIGGYIKIGSFTTVQSQTNCIPNLSDNPYISEIMIGSSQTPSDLMCAEGYTTIPIVAYDTGMGATSLNQDLNGFPYIQACYYTCQTVCDQTAVVTDIRFSVDMGMQGGQYVPGPFRCCLGPNDNNCTWYPPLSINEQRPNLLDAGQVPNNVSGCVRAGICVTKTKLGLLRSEVAKGRFRRVRGNACTPGPGQYLPANNIVFIQAPADATPSTILQNWPGYCTDGVNLHQGCTGGKGVFIAKKFVTVQ